MADNVYGFDDSKSKVQVVDKATQDAKDSEQDTAIANKQDPIVAGTGISIGADGKTINHSNEVTPKTAYVGSATAIPRIKFDENGHITGVTTATVYPPTTPGEAGQVWMSDGAGAGYWTNLPTKVIDDVLFTLTSLSVIPSQSSSYCKYKATGRLNFSVLSPSSLTGVTATLSLRVDISGVLEDTSLNLTSYFTTEVSVSNTELLSGTCELDISGSYTPVNPSSYSNTTYYAYDVLNASKSVSGTLTLSDGSVYSISLA